MEMEKTATLEKKRQSAQCFMDYDMWRHITLNINTQSFPYISVAKTSDHFSTDLRQNIFTSRN